NREALPTGQLCGIGAVAPRTILVRAPVVLAHCVQGRPQRRGPVLHDFRLHGVEPVGLVRRAARGVVLEAAFIDIDRNDRIGAARAQVGGAAIDGSKADAIGASKRHERFRGAALRGLHAGPVVGIPGRDVGQLGALLAPGGSGLYQVQLVGSRIDVLVIYASVAAATTRIVDADVPSSGLRIVDDDLFVVTWTSTPV